MTARDVDGWLLHVDAYVDGALDDKQALRLQLAAESSGELRRAIEEARAFHAALGAMPVEHPGPGFDPRVLESVPLERYASAPRRHPVILTLGAWAPSPVQKLARRLGAGLSAVAAAWIVALVVGSTALQGPIAAVWGRLGLRLDAWADASASTPVLGAVARALSGAYDATFGALGSMSGSVGLGLAIFLLGAVVGGLGLFWAASRRRSATSGRSAHHA